MTFKFVSIPAISLLIAGCCSPASPAQPPATSRSVTISDLNHGFAVIGWLGQPLGTIVTITGRAVRAGERNDYWSVNMARNLFHVETVDGKAVEATIEVFPLKNDDIFPMDGPVTFVGFEDGGFVGEPSGIDKVDPAHFTPQQRNRGFYTQFFSIKIEKPR